MKSEETYEIKINLDISDDFTINTDTDNEGTIIVNVQGRENHTTRKPVKESSAWAFVRLAFLGCIIVSIPCIIIICACGYLDLAVATLGSCIVIGSILFSVLVAHAFSMAEKEEATSGIKRKYHYPYLGV